jgi:hypothetical protein
MARSARKPERESDEIAKQTSTKPDKTISTPPAGAAADTAAEAASATSTKPDIELAGFQGGQFSAPTRKQQNRNAKGWRKKAIWAGG